MIDQSLTIMAEQSVLGSLLVDNSRFHEVAELIDAASFGHRPYGKLFVAIGELVADHEVANERSVHEAMRARGEDEEAGSLEHLSELAASVASGSRVVVYARKMAEFARVRQVSDLIANMPDIVANAENVDAAIDQIQARLGELQRAKGRGEPKSLGACVLEAVSDMEAIAAGEKSPGWSTGLQAIDKALGGGLKAGRVYTLAARTSVGKTSLAMHILLGLAGDGHPGLMLSQEMVGSELAVRAIANSGSIAMERLALADLNNDAGWRDLAEAADRLMALPVWVDDQPALRLIDIASKARAIKRRHGLDVLVVDYLQLCAAEHVKGQSRHHQIEGISRGIKALAKELGVAVLLLSQLNRSAEDGEPELFHLKESGAVEEDADAVLLLYAAGTEPDGAQTVRCKVAKNRGGKRGHLALAFDGSRQRWYPSATDLTQRAHSKGGHRPQ